MKIPKTNETELSGTKLHSSFRDPSGYVFRDSSGKLLRYVSLSYKEDYDFLHSSGLYDSLRKENLLVAHNDYTDRHAKLNGNCYRVIKPEEIPFISYPYEWSFSQLKDAALATLKIQRIALKHGMALKDASAYNIQFLNGQPVLIDTLSFEKYKQGQPWYAYRQFCQHFLAPLALASYVDIRFFMLLREHIDGIPLDLASMLLPRRTKLRPQLAMHLHLHAKSQKKHANVDSFKMPKVSLSSVKNLAESLEIAVNKLSWEPEGTEWGEYYSFTNYSSDAFSSKKKIVKTFIDKTKPKTVWDLGANTGEFSRLASSDGVLTLALDVDPAAVEKNYRQQKNTGESYILPLVMDLTNPSPSLGWAHRERVSLEERGPADLLIALALIHHLAISNNLPFEDIASYFAVLGSNLIIEFVPKEDSQVQKLLVSRKNIFTNYHKEDFEQAFSKFYNLVSSSNVKGSKRTIYLMQAKKLYNRAR